MPLLELPPPVITVVTSDVTIANTTGETSLLTADELIAARIASRRIRFGSVFEMRLGGSISCDAGPDHAIWSAWLGETKVTENDQHSPLSIESGISDAFWDLCVSLTCRDAGESVAFAAEGRMLVAGASSPSTPLWLWGFDGPITVASGVPLGFDVRWKWENASAGNTITRTFGKFQFTEAA